MFGIGFTELLLISIIAILFLGPDKLPSALMDMAKFIKSVKKTISETKSTLEEEMKISDLKEEAMGYKKQLTEATDELKNFKNISFDDEDDVSYDDEISEVSPMDHVEKTKKTSKEGTKQKETPEETLAQDDTSPETTQKVATQVEPKKSDELVTFKKPKNKSKKSDA